jgi:tetratricopeptide (TPR) repeat protein
MLRSRLSAAICVALLWAGTDTLAQPAPAKPAPPDAAARTDGTTTAARRLDSLFEKLKNAESAEVAKPLAAEVDRALENSGSATADLIRSRVSQAMEAREFDTALDLLDFLVALRPGWAEPYHRRAILHFLRQDHDAALRDIRETLAREPRHYHALAGLGALLKLQGDTKGAFRVYTRVLEIYPFYPDIRESLEKMRPEVEGQPI